METEEVKTEPQEQNGRVLDVTETVKARSRKAQEGPSPAREDPGQPERDPEPTPAPEAQVAALGNITPEQLRQIEAGGLVNVNFVLQGTFGLTDSEGNVVQMIPLDPVRIPALTEEAFAGTLGQLREVRARLLKELNEGKLAARNRFREQQKTARRAAEKAGVGGRPRPRDTRRR